MKILLVNPWQAELFPPPSLGYIQAAAKAAGADVTAVDMGSESFADAAGQQWDIVGVSFHSFSVQHARNLRRLFEGQHLICGGHHPSALPQQMLDLGYDQVIKGEGENAIIDIINGNTNRIIEGTAVDINAMPCPDYTGFKYTNAMGLPVISSRGCPFACSFCASKSFWGRRYRVRSADNVLAEIERNRAAGVMEFMFEDDNFTLHRERALEICDGLIAMGSPRWQCASRAETLIDEELCRRMRQAGCHTVWLGIETLSQATLDRIAKHTTVGRQMLGVETAERAGINTMSQFIIGLPEDTLADIEETARNIKRSHIRRKGCNIAWVLPDTEIHRQAKLRGFDDSIYLDSGAPFYTYERSMNTLQYWANLINQA